MKVKYIFAMLYTIFIVNMSNVVYGVMVMRSPLYIFLRTLFLILIPILLIVIITYFIKAKNNPKRIKNTLFITVIGILIIIGIHYVSGFFCSSGSGSSSLPSSEDINLGYITTQLEKTDEITVIPTMKDTIKADSSWCGTFQLAWNDMKNELVKKDIVFDPQEKMAKNLNKEEFKSNMLSEEYYVKDCGLMTFELKEKIKKNIKEKFNLTSDLLDEFEWKQETNSDYFFYTMLYKNIEFLQEFNKLDKGIFGSFPSNYSIIEYFGIDENTDGSVGDQIEVLYYNSKEDFAIIINTKTNDEVIFCKSPKGSTFNEIYDNMNNTAISYKGSKDFENIDEFKAPNLTFNEEREYSELENKLFTTTNGKTMLIAKALQTIKFSLNEKGGEIKSEAGIAVIPNAMPVEKSKIEQPRYFHLDDTFAIFLREKGKSLPYFAGRIYDITKFQ